MTRLKNKTIVLFDGECNLCSGIVQWVLKRDNNEKITLVPWQSQVGKKYLNNAIPSTVVVLKNNVVFMRSDATIEILRSIGGIWRLAVILKWIPGKLRDKLYDWIARNRYRWFGKPEHCQLQRR